MFDFTERPHLSRFGSVFELSTLTGTNGFQINGEAAGDRSGISVASAGDVNGDGFDDLGSGLIAKTGQSPRERMRIGTGLRIGHSG